MRLFRGLLISSKRNFENSALSEITYALTRELNIPQEKIFARRAGISGLSVVKLDDDIDILETIKQLISLEENQSFFIHTLKIRPIEYVMKFDIPKLIDFMKIKNFHIEGSFKIEVNKRHNPVHSLDIINEVAKLYSNPVNLDNPSTLILIEIIGDKLGLSVIPPELVYRTGAGDDDNRDEDNWFL